MPEACGAARVGIIVPTLNAGSLWQEWLAAYEKQSLKADEQLVIDSASTDATVSRAEAAGFRVLPIARAEFNHGSTRQMAVEQLSGCDLLIFMTQDAVLASPNSLRELLAPFADPQVAGVCGRQLPHAGAGPIEAFARLFNYPPVSAIRTQQDIDRLGLKAAFFSNSFAAYRRSSLLAVGGFPGDVILAEDMYVAAKLLLAGHKLAYAADATVYHSHAYTLTAEFKRYFDIGVFLREEPWIGASFGKSKGEGLRYLLTELKYLLDKQPFMIFPALVRNCLKLLGFQCGKRSTWLPRFFRSRLSMHRGYW
jgi:rhamnosyltransferase